MSGCVLPLSELSESKHPWQLLICILSEPSMIKNMQSLLNHAVDQLLHPGLLSLLKSVGELVVEVVIEFICLLNMLQVESLNQICHEIFLESKDISRMGRLPGHSHQGQGDLSQ